MDLVKKKRGKFIGYFPSYVLKRIENNQNFLFVICGSVGSGKSYAGIKYGQMLDPDFDVRNIIFSPQQFMSLINERTKNLKRGAYIMWDEMQLGMSHLEYQSVQARLINYVLQTFRHRNFILCVTAPHFSFLNASVRKLFHSRWETQGLNYKENTCKIKPLILQCSQSTNKIYQKYLRVWTKERGIFPLKALHLSLADKKLIKNYEDKKQKFLQSFNRDIEVDLKMNSKKELTLQQQQVVNHLKDGLVVPEIAKIMGIIPISVYNHMELIQKKGVVIKPEYGDNRRVVAYKLSDI